MEGEAVLSRASVGAHRLPAVRIPNLREDQGRRQDRLRGRRVSYLLPPGAGRRIMLVKTNMRTAMPAVAMNTEG